LTIYPAAGVLDLHAEAELLTDQEVNSADPEVVRDIGLRRIHKLALTPQMAIVSY